MDASALLLATSPTRLALIQEALEQAGWTVDAFVNPQEALGSLRQSRYQAVFCDEQLRGASAGGFLAWTRRVSGELPFYLLSSDGPSSNGPSSNGSSSTGSSSNGAGGQAPGKRRPAVPPGQVRSSAARAGVTEVLPFPPAAADLPRPRGGTPSPDLEPSAVPLSGNTALVALADLLEMMGIAGQSGIVELDGGEQGAIFVEKGLLTHAVSRAGRSSTIGGSTIGSSGRGSSFGLQALAELILLEDAAFRVVPYQRPPRLTINLPAAGAMTEAARLADEQQRYRQLVQRVVDGCPTVTAVAAGYPLADGPSHGFGEAEELFRNAKAVLEAMREQVGLISEMTFATGDHCTVLTHFGDRNLLAARAPSAHGRTLRRAVEEALGGEGR